jgi:N-formylglutamate amidohydrolase
MSSTETVYFDPYHRHLEKEIAREKDIFYLKTGAVTLNDLHDRNRAISKKRMATLKVVSWGL